MTSKKFEKKLVNKLSPGIVQSEMSKKNEEKRYVIVVNETLHYRLRQVALKRKMKLIELVTQLLVEGLKQP